MDQNCQKNRFTIENLIFVWVELVVMTLLNSFANLAQNGTRAVDWDTFDTVNITTKWFSYGISALISLPGLYLAGVMLYRFVLQCRENRISANVYGIILAIVCILNLVFIDITCGSNLAEDLGDVFTVKKSVKPVYFLLDDFLEITVHTFKVVQKLIVIAQSFDRYILICQPQVKHILTVVQASLISFACLVLGVLNWFLHFKSSSDFEKGNTVFERHWHNLIFGYAVESDDLYVPVSMIAYPIYHFVVSLIPCILGIYFSWCTKVELKKACAFVNNERRNEKFARIMKLSALFTWLHLFYLLVDIGYQANLLYDMVQFTKPHKRPRERLYNFKNFYWQIIDRFVFLLYALQSPIISYIFFWFMTKAKE